MKNGHGQHGADAALVMFVALKSKVHFVLNMLVVKHTEVRIDGDQVFQSGREHGQGFTNCIVESNIHWPPVGAFQNRVRAL